MKEEVANLIKELGKHYEYNYHTKDGIWYREDLQQDIPLSKTTLISELNFYLGQYENKKHILGQSYDGEFEKVINALKQQKYNYYKNQFIPGEAYDTFEKVKEIVLNEQFEEDNELIERLEAITYGVLPKVEQSYGILIQRLTYSDYDNEEIIEHIDGLLEEYEQVMKEITHDLFKEMDINEIELYIQDVYNKERRTTYELNYDENGNDIYIINNDKYNFEKLYNQIKNEVGFKELSLVTINWIERFTHVLDKNIGLSI